MKNSLRYWLCAAAVAVPAAAGFAGLKESTEARYSHRIKNDDARALPASPTAQPWLNACESIELQLEAPPASMPNAQGHFTGQCASFGFPLQVELPASLVDGRLHIPRSPAEVELLLTTWAASYLAPRPVLPLQPKLVRLEFRDDVGFVEQLSLQSDFRYTAVVEIPYDGKTGQLVDSRSRFAELRQFIGQIEKDARSRVVLQNNRSQLPAFIVFTSSGLMARHPWHEVLARPVERDFHYQFVDAIGDVQDFPEIRKAMKHNEVRGFLGIEKDIRVHFAGTSKFHSIVFTGSTGRRIRYIAEKRRARVEPV